MGVIEEVFSDVVGRESIIVINYKNLLNTLKTMNMPEEVSRMIAIKSDEHYLLSCYEKMLKNSR